MAKNGLHHFGGAGTVVSASTGHGGGTWSQRGSNDTQGIDFHQTLNLHVVSNLNETLIQTQTVQELENQPPTLGAPQLLAAVAVQPDGDLSIITASRATASTRPEPAPHPDTRSKTMDKPQKAAL